MPGWSRSRCGISARARHVHVLRQYHVRFRALSLPWPSSLTFCTAATKLKGFPKACGELSAECPASPVSTPALAPHMAWSRQMGRQTHSSSPAHSTAACSLGTPSINLSNALPAGPAKRTSDPTKNRVAALLLATSSAYRSCEPARPSLGDGRGQRRADQLDVAPRSTLGVSALPGASAAGMCELEGCSLGGSPVNGTEVMVRRAAGVWTPPSASRQ